MDRPSLVAFDMDGTLIRGRFIIAVGEKYGLTDKILGVMNSATPGYLKSQEIARLLTNLREIQLLEVITSMQLTLGADQTMSELRDRGCKIGIISDSYTLATDYISQKLGMDFSVANRLEVNQSVVTGRIGMPLGWVEDSCTCRRSVCKGFHLERLAERFRIPLSNCIAVGDSDSDICMLRKAKVGVAFDPKDSSVSNEAQFIITRPDLRKTLQYLTELT